MRDLLPGLGEKSSGDGDMKKAGSGKGELDIVCLAFFQISVLWQVVFSK